MPLHTNLFMMKLFECLAETRHEILTIGAAKRVIGKPGSLQCLVRFLPHLLEGVAFRNLEMYALAGLQTFYVHLYAFVLFFHDFSPKLIAAGDIPHASPQTFFARCFSS